jgi:hypothetical protein
MAFGFPPRFTESRTFHLSQDELPAAVKSTFENLGWGYTVPSGNEFQTHISMSGWSWGEELTAKVLRDGVIQVESKCHGYRPQIVDFGKNRANVETFFAQLQHRIAQGPDWTSISASAHQPIAQGNQPVPKNSRAAAVFIGCIVAFFLFAIFLFFISAVIGLLTGHLYLPDRGGGSGTLHGPWARITSGIILMFFAWILVRVLRRRRQSRRSNPFSGP